VTSNADAAPRRRSGRKAAAPWTRRRRDEQQAFALARAFGRGSALSLDVLGELRLILRLLRWKRMRAQFSAIAAALCDDDIPMAAE